MSKKRRFLSEEEKREICELYQKGISCKDLGRRFNSDPSWIGKIIKKQGFWEPKIKRYQHYTFQGDEKVLSKIRSLIGEGWSVPEICKETNLTQSIVLRLMRDNDIKRNSISIIKRKYFLNENWIDEIDSPEKAIFLGLFFADGCNYLHSNECMIGLQLKEEDYLYRFCLCFTDKPLQKTRSLKKIQINSKRWSDKMYEYGATPKKSLILEWPKNLPDEFIPYFIRGYFEGDGSISKRVNKNAPYWYQVQIVGTLQFLTELNLQIRKHLNFQGRIYDKKTGKNTYSLVISRQENVKAFGDWIYSDCLDFAMKRKLALFQEQTLLRFS